MEYIPGKNLQDLDLGLDINKEIVRQIATIISHLGQMLGSQTPGPLRGGACRGYLWGGSGDNLFPSTL